MMTCFYKEIRKENRKEIDSGESRPIEETCGMGIFIFRFVRYSFIVLAIIDIVFSLKFGQKCIP